MKNKLRTLLSIIMAVMLLLPALATLSLATEGEQEVIKEITSQPTSTLPAVEVNALEGASYQWYEVERTSAEITDEHVTYAYGSYSEDGWTGSTAYYPHEFFQIQLKRGDRIVIPYVDGIDDYYFVSTDALYSLYPYLVGENLCYDVSADSDYNLFLQSDDAVTTKIYLEAPNDVKLEGQTSSTLSEFEIGKEYKVVVSYEDGTVLDSDSFLMDYQIISHPSESDPSIKTNADGDATQYKWYVVEKNGIEYTVSQKIGAETEAYIYRGWYENNLWDGEDGYINLVVTAYSNNDVLKIKVPEGFDGFVGLYNGSGNPEYNEGKFEKDEDGVYYYEFTHIHSLDFEIDTAETLTGVEIWLESNGEIKKVVDPSYISDETMELIPRDIDYGSYEDGKWLSEEDIFWMDLDIEKENAIIEISAPDGVDVYVYETTDEIQIQDTYENGVHRFNVSNDGYQIRAYSYGEPFELEIKLIVGESVYNLVEEFSRFADQSKTMYVSYVNDGFFKDGKWYVLDNSDEINIAFELDKGYIITVTPSEEFDGDVVLYLYDIINRKINLVETNGKYIFVTDDYCYLDLVLENCENDFSAEITVQKCDAKELLGEAEKRLARSVPGIYFAEVEFKDSTVRTSLSFELTICDHKLNENALDCTSEVECTVCGETLQPSGHSFSEWKTTTHPQRKQGGTEQRMCLQCGETEAREIPKTGGISNGAIVGIIIGSGALLSAAACLAAYLIFKKKSLKL